MERASYSFNLTIIFCILFVVVPISRLVLYLLRKHLSPSGVNCALWAVGEEIVGALFASLYITLMMEGEQSFFEVVGRSFGVLFGICIYPYTLLYLGLSLHAERNMEEQSADPASLIKFYDEYKKLRLVIASEAVIYLKSEENYVQIHHTDNGRVRKFVLRSSMRALEEQMTRHGLVRCHRSYFINPDYIKMIHKEPSGVVVAELTTEGVESIPISRKYQEEITRRL